MIEELFMAAGDQTATVIDAAWARQVLAAWRRRAERGDTYRRRLSPDEFLHNPFTGRPLEEEDSPGNYTVRDTEHGLEYACYGPGVTAYFVHVTKPSPDASDKQ